MKNEIRTYTNLTDATTGSSGTIFLVDIGMAEGGLNAAYATAVKWRCAAMTLAG